MDPNTVVALASSTFKGTGRELHDDVHNEPTVPVLDALAELCVQNPKHDVIAIGLRLHLPTIQLLVATNDETPDTATIQHLNEIWSLLKKISDQHLAGKKIDMEVDSRSIYRPTKEEQSLTNQLLRRVCQHSYLLFRKRHAKYLTVIEDFYRARREQQDFPDEIEDLLKVLESVLSYLRLISDTIEAYHRDNWKVDDIRMNQDFMPLLGDILVKANTLLADVEVCERWMSQVNFPPIRLRRAIEKLVALPRNINTLMRFAFSPRMRQMFDDTILQVIPVHHQTPLAGNWPSDAKEWQEFRQIIYDRHGLEDARHPNEKTVIERLLTGGKQTVHCECALISFLHRQPSLPAFSYIGISKLSCKACYLWLSAYNQHANSGQYRTKGATDKWYTGWQRPVLDQKTQAKVDDALVEMVEKEFCEMETDIGNAREKASYSYHRLFNYSAPVRKRDTPGFDLGFRRKR